MKANKDRLNASVNVLVIFSIGFMLLRPGGPINEWMRERAEEKATVARVNDIWTDIAELHPSRLGNQVQPADLVEFADYECPFCRDVHQTLDSALVNSHDLTISYVHYPLTQIHKAARGAALAAICAERAGRFEEMHRWLYETTQWMEDQDWAAGAVMAGITDTVAFNGCLQSNVAIQRLERDIALGDSIGVRATPSFAYKDGFESGAATIDELLAKLSR